MSNWRKSWNWIVLAALVLGLLPMVTLAAPSQPDWSKVEGSVMAALDAEGEAGFYVILTTQADLSSAAALKAKVDKTTYVFEHLKAVADQTQGPVMDYLRSMGVKGKPYYIQNMIEVGKAGRNVVEGLVAWSDVAQIMPLPSPQMDPVIQGMSPEQRIFAIEWNITRVGAPDVWAMGITGQGMVVADNDTGVQYDHPALVNQYRGNLGGGNFDHNYNWWDAWGGTPSPTPVDYDGHGTHTMGTMVGDDGGANQIGVAPGAQWVACAGLNLECFEFFLTPWDLSGQYPDPSKAPDSINNSWYDTSGFDYRPIVQALNAAGIAVIKSAGNWGSACSTISPPGNVPEIIATAAFGQGDVIASFSSRGPDSTYGQTILKPEVAAPGVNVRSSYPTNTYDYLSGTSMAAPHSTASVALIWSAAPCLQGDVPTTKQIMMETAEAKIDAQCVPFVDHPNDVWGWGILDEVAAVQFAIGYCGGLGTLEGTVTDAATAAPLAGVAVRALAAGGYSKTVTTDASGFYAMGLPADTYDVTATVYGYQQGLASGVVVEADTTTVQDFGLTALPVWTVSGYVKDAVTMAPLAAAVEFTDAPVPPVSTNPVTGFYSIQVAQGSWHLKAKAPLHLPVTVEVIVAGNVTQDFFLEPLPCILLVDDDNNAPDTRPYFTAALAAMGLDYAVFDTGGGDGPTLDGLAGYRMVFWFSGDAYGSTAGPNAADEANLTTWLDGGGRLFLSSQDYLYDFGLTPFGQNYLGIGSFSSDSGGATGIVGIAGDPIGGGLGPFSLTYPSGFSDYGDIVTAGNGGSQAFEASNSTNDLDVDKAGGDWKTVFFGTDWVALYNNNAANGITVLQRIVDWFGGCAPPPVNTVTCGSITGFVRMDPFGNLQAKWKVTVVDQDGNPAGNVAVTADLTSPSISGTRTRMSKANGLASFPWRSKMSGDWTIDVSDMVKAGYSFIDGDQCSASMNY